MELLMTIVVLEGSFNPPKQTGLNRWYNDVPKKESDKQPITSSKNLDNTNDQSTAPVLNQYSNNFFNEMTSSKQIEPEIPNLKADYALGNTGRASPIRISLDEATEKFKLSNFNKEEIIEKADIKPPEYFKINPQNFN